MPHQSFPHAGGSATDNDDLNAFSVEFGNLFNNGAKTGERRVAGGRGHGRGAGFDEEAAGGLEREAGRRRHV